MQPTETFSAASSPAKTQAIGSKWQSNDNLHAGDEGSIASKWSQDLPTPHASRLADCSIYPPDGRNSSLMQPPIERSYRTIHRRQFIETTLGVAAAAGMVRSPCRQPSRRHSRRADWLPRPGRGHIGNARQAYRRPLRRRRESARSQGAMSSKEARPEGRHVHRLPPAARSQGHRRDLDRHAEPHALADRDCRRAGRQGCVRREAGQPQSLGRPAVGQRLATSTNESSSAARRPARSQSLTGAVAYVHSGKLGQIEYVVGTCFKPRMSIGKSDKPLADSQADRLRLVVRPGGRRSIYRPEKNSQAAATIRTTIGTGTTTPAAATWATRASTKWISPAGSSARRRCRAARRELRRPRSATKTPATRRTRKSCATTTRRRR